MAVSLPKYGLTVPSETTRFRDLGKELREMGLAIEDILDSFDYNGADPNLVLARVAALETWLTTVNGKVAALEAAELTTQTGTHTFGSISASGNGTATITFAQPYAEPPEVLAPWWVVPQNSCIPYINEVTAEGMVLRARNTSSSPVTPGACRWTVKGVLA